MRYSPGGGDTWTHMRATAEALPDPLTQQHEIPHLEYTTRKAPTAPITHSASYKHAYVHILAEDGLGLLAR